MFRNSNPSIPCQKHDTDRYKVILCRCMGPGVLSLDFMQHTTRIPHHQIFPNPNDLYQSSFSLNPLSPTPRFPATHIGAFCPTSAPTWIVSNLSATRRRPRYPLPPRMRHHSRCSSGRKIPVTSLVSSNQRRLPVHLAEQSDRA